jgi:hypothetical protein
MSTDSTSFSRSCIRDDLEDRLATRRVSWRYRIQLYLALFVQRAWLERSDALLNDRCKRSGVARETSLAAHPGAADRLAHVKTDDDMKNRIHLVFRGRTPHTAARAFALPQLSISAIFRFASGAGIERRWRPFCN